LAISGHLPAVEALYTPPSEATRIYAANGDLIASLYQENRANIPLSQIPRTFQRAVIDTEDAGFYRHHGISLRGVLRASFRNVRERGLEEVPRELLRDRAAPLRQTSLADIPERGPEHAAERDPVVAVEARVFGVDHGPLKRPGDL